MRWKFGCGKTLALACLVGFVPQAALAQIYYSNGSTSTNNRSSSSPSSSFNGSSGLKSIFGVEPAGTTFGGSNISGTTYGGGLGMGTGLRPGQRMSPGLGPAPGVSSFTGMGMSPSQYNYYYGNTSTRYGMPVGTTPLGIGYYQLGGLAGGMSYWRAPSGYYYPWGASSIYGAGGYTPTHVTYVYQGGAFAESKPSVPSVINDLRRFVEDAKSKQQLDDSNYEQLTVRLNDITEQTRAMSQNNGGTLNVSDEQTVRRALDELITEITRALNP
jgi:hypothetical protein